MRLIRLLAMIARLRLTRWRLQVILWLRRHPLLATARLMLFRILIRASTWLATLAVRFQPKD